MRIEMSYISLL